jgi:hypothetical protein
MMSPRVWRKYLQKLMHNLRIYIMPKICFYQYSKKILVKIFVFSEGDEIIRRSWVVYLEIGEGVIGREGQGQGQGQGQMSPPPHQHFLTAYVSIFSTLFPTLKSRLVVKELTKLNRILGRSLVIPLSADGATSVLFSSSDSGMTPLQDQIYHVYDIIIKVGQGQQRSKSCHAIN